MTKQALGGWAALAFVTAANGMAAGPAQQPALFGGGYAGNYTCEGRQSAFTLDITQDSSGTLTARGVFPNQYIDYSKRSLWDRRPPDSKKPIEFKGTLDPRTGSLSLSSKDELQLTGGGKRQKITLDGAIHASNQFLVGQVKYPGCTRFVTAPKSARDAHYAAVIYANGLQAKEQQLAAAVQREEKRAARLASGWVPVELTPSGGAVTENRFDYYDATLSGTPAPSLALGILPIEEVHQWFYANGHKCLGTKEAGWRSGVATATTELFGKKSYVLECRGECRNLQYEFYVHTNALTAGTHHAGKSQPYPVITVNASPWVESKVEFRVRYASAVPSQLAQIRVHTWSPGWGDYGGGCNID